MDKQQIAKAFGKKATTYDVHARVQKYVGHNLIRLLIRDAFAESDVVDGPILDLGTGSGYFLPALRNIDTQRPLMAADLSEGMMRHVQAKYSDQLDYCFVADAEQLPLPDDSLAVVFSSMAIQWCEDLTQLFSELSRVVKPGGFIAFSTLLPDTLCELKDAWHQVDQRVHVNRFLSASQIETAMQPYGAVHTSHRERVVAGYPDLKRLLHSIKGIGANTVVDGSGNMTKGQYGKLIKAYDSFRDASGMLPASYDVFYGVLQVPER
ncbi:malonyl-ACP O-methyltransferase BioC [Litoribrevibacter euphylliae]|uniref:Malonyl-[acyl-carrier protein] O-methyltransferase n=1 Tax=Litoribrevibacter euphylliae TaxID=1834034 RepID=A0ABV7HL96_9GAMM